MDKATAGSRERSSRLVAAGDHQLIILDVTDPLDWGRVDVDDGYATVRQEFSHLNMVCAGRNAPERLAGRAGRRGSKGIEF